MADSKTPSIVKVYLAGMVPLYIGAKVHTWMTWDSGHYLESHWPFWAAPAVWTVAVTLADQLVSWLKTPPSPPEWN